MIYIIYGQDNTKIDYLLEQVKLKHPRSEQIKPDTPLDQDLVTSLFYTSSMLSEGRLVILEDDSIFTKVKPELIHPDVDLVIVQRENYAPKTPRSNDIVLLEAKRIPLIFKFLDELTESSAKTNVERFFEISKTQEVVFIFYQLVSHLRRLILAKAESGFAAERLADWQVQKYKRIAQRFSFEKLKIGYKMLLAAEIEVKTGKAQLNQALPLLLLRLTQNFQRP